MAEEKIKEEQGQSLLTPFGKSVSDLQSLVYGAYTKRGCADNDNAAKEGCGMKNIPSEALGYFENRKDNTYIRVTRGAIILNEFNEIDNGDLSQNSCGKQTVIESIAGEYYNILPRSIEYSQVFVDAYGFTYDSKNDVWRYNEEIYYNKEMSKKEGNKDKDERETGYPWTRINFDLNSNASYVIVIGDTGVGKSSLLKLLTNYNGIKTSDGVESCTNSTSFYALLSKNICFVDTRGTEDTDTNVTDEQTLNNIQRKMHRFHGSLCKIIWIVHPASRKNKHLEQQVSFISKLGETVNETDDNKESKDNNNEAEMNIWDSVMIIVCQPKTDSILSKEIKGVIGKTQEKGCSKDHWKVGKNLFGYTNLDWMDQTRKEVKKMKKRLRKELKSDSDSESDSDNDNNSEEKGHHGNGLHYYYNKDIKSFIYDSLLNNEIIQPFKLLNLNYKCIKCGIIGNPKFVDDLKCHSKAQRYHPSHVGKNGINNPGEMIESVTETHSNNGKYERKHCGKIVSFHNKALRVRYHCGELTRRHPMESIISTGGKWTIGIAAAVGGLAALALAGSGVSGVAAVAAAAGTSTETAALALGAVAGASVRNAVAAIGRMTRVDNVGRYPCCGGNLMSEGCLAEYSCCLRQSGDEGCRTLNESDRKYKCCGNEANHPGCKEKYDCCDQAPNSVGCRQACRDCKELINSKGCSYEMKCCGIKGLLKDKNDEKDGCLTKCQNCKKSWGISISVNDEYWKDNGPAPSEPQGCCNWHSHQMVKID